jgi:NitT/TauT family transport system substrate-binding protein
MEAGGKVLIDDRTAVTTILVARAGFLATQRELVRKFVAAHIALNAWIKANPVEAQRLALAELDAELRGSMSAELVSRSFQRIELVDTISREALDSFIKSAQSVGFLRAVPDMAKLREQP